MSSASSSVTDAYTHFGEWLQDQPYWLQDAVYCIYHNIDIDDNLIDSYVNMCIAQSKKEAPSYRHLTEKEFKKSSSSNIAILSLSNIIGVNALASDAKLEFKPNVINVIYGLNGAGKSGYMRIFKQLSGSPYEEPIQPNVFKSGSTEKPTCVFSIQIDGEEKNNIKCDLSTKNKNSILSECDVFDTHISNGYISKDNSPSFRPFVFSVLAELSDIAGRISNRIHSQIDNISLTELAYPSNLSFEGDTAWVKNLTAETTISDLFTSWTDEQEKRLIAIESLIDNEKVEQKLNLCKVQKESLSPILSDLKNAQCLISSNDIEKAYVNYTATKSRYTAAKKLFSETADPKDKISISSNDWKSLWTIARRYYEDHIYEEGSKHFGEEGTICPLCHQKIAPPYSIRFTNVNDYVNGSCSEDYRHACSDLERIISTFRKRNYNAIQAKQMLTETGALSNVEYTVLLELYKSISQIDPMSDLEKAYSKVLLINLNEPVDLLIDKYDSLCKQIEEFNNLLKDEKHIELEKEYNHLLCCKWIIDNKNLIDSNIRALKQSKILNNTLTLLTTNKITSESNKLAEALISAAYIQRFDEERRLLAPDINVRLEKVPSKKGKSPYKLALNSVGHDKYNPEYILSEGEQRIIALAEFFADATGRENDTPVIIDDPISSLDIKYEIKATERIVALAQERQVIIFTHRISLLKEISEACEQYEVEPNNIFIHSTERGKGVIDLENEFHGSIKKLLNGYLQRITEVKRKDPSSSEYKDSLKALYQQFRTCVEKSVEDVLLMGIVTRFDRIIHTKGKIKKLSSISDDDCKIIDSMMTKYSFKEHSQPTDSATINIPIDELKTDIEKYIEWIDKYTARLKKK